MNSEIVTVTKEVMYQNGKTELVEGFCSRVTDKKHLSEIIIWGDGVITSRINQL